jgi:hypothetical protein
MPEATVATDPPTEEKIATIMCTQFVEYLQIHLARIIIEPIESVLKIHKLNPFAKAYLELIDEKVNRLEWPKALEPGKECELLFCFDMVMTAAGVFNALVQFHRICSRHGLRVDRVNVENIVYQGASIDNTIKNKALIHFQPK